MHWSDQPQEFSVGVELLENKVIFIFVRFRLIQWGDNIHLTSFTLTSGHWEQRLKAVWLDCNLKEVLYNWHLISDNKICQDLWSTRLDGGHTMTPLLTRHNNLPRENLFVIWLSPAPFMADKNKYHQPSHSDHHWENCHFLYFGKETPLYSCIIVTLLQTHCLFYYWYKSANMTK